MQVSDTCQEEVSRLSCMTDRSSCMLNETARGRMFHSSRTGLPDLVKASKAVRRCCQFNGLTGYSHMSIAKCVNSTVSPD